MAGLSDGGFGLREGLVVELAIAGSFEGDAEGRLGNRFDGDAQPLAPLEVGIRRAR